MPLKRHHIRIHNTNCRKIDVLMRILVHLYSSTPRVKDTTLNLMQWFDISYLAKDKENWNVEVVELWNKVTLHYNKCPCMPSDFIR
jgi:hypothetical protein